MQGVKQQSTETQLGFCCQGLHRMISGVEHVCRPARACALCAVISEHSIADNKMLVKTGNLVVSAGCTAQKTSAVTRPTQTKKLGITSMSVMNAYSVVHGYIGLLPDVWIAQWGMPKEAGHSR